MTYTVQTYILDVVYCVQMYLLKEGEKGVMSHDRAAQKTLIEVQFMRREDIGYTDAFPVPCQSSLGVYEPC